MSTKQSRSRPAPPEIPVHSELQAVAAGSPTPSATANHFNVFSVNLPEPESGAKRSATTSDGSEVAHERNDLGELELV